MYKLLVFTLAASLFLLSCDSQKSVDREVSDEPNPYVHVKNGHFEIADKPYYFLGTNFWYGMNLGSKGKSGNRDRLIKELDRLQQLGITNLRIMGMTEGPDSEPYRIVPSLQDSAGNYNGDLLEGLDFALAEMSKRNMTAVICMNNFWAWSGGFAQYVQWTKPQDSIPYPPPHPNGSYDVYQKYAASFYSNQPALQRYFKALEEIVQRKNSITQLPYKEDKTIMAWELCNEPRGINNTENYLKWIDSSSALIKKMDPNHLVTIGSEGETASPEYSGVEFVKAHQFKNIDYTTVHIWIQNWNWYNPKDSLTYPSAKQKALDYLHKHTEQARSLGKPIVLEEFGIMKDHGSFDPKATNKSRDDFYNTMIGAVYEAAKRDSSISGVNFWAWAGEGRPKKMQGWWKAGDDFIGDPPHEEQGWYSVYDTDSTTLSLLGAFGRKFGELNK